MLRKKNNDIILRIMLEILFRLEYVANIYNLKSIYYYFFLTILFALWEYVSIVFNVFERNL